MIYKKYGETFKKLRQQKQLSLSNFPANSVSTSAISKFERGDTMISFDKLLQSLEVLDVTLEEYELLLNNNSVHDSKILMQEIDQAIFEQDNTKLLKLIKKSQKEGFFYISLSAKASMTQLTEFQAEKLTDYFFALDVWLPSDLWMLSLTVASLQVHDILHLIDGLLQTKHNLVNSTHHRDYLVRTLCEASYHLTILGYKNYSKHILNQIESWKITHFSAPDSIFLKTLYELTLDFWISHFQNPSVGKKEMERFLKIFSELGFEELSNYFTIKYSTISLSGKNSTYENGL